MITSMRLLRRSFIIKVLPVFRITRAFLKVTFNGGGNSICEMYLTLVNLQVLLFSCYAVKETLRPNRPSSFQMELQETKKIIFGIFVSFKTWTDQNQSQLTSKRNHHESTKIKQESSGTNLYLCVRSTFALISSLW